jgi:DNA repair protein RadA/Sms
MKTKSKTTFVCQECGSESPRWAGKCTGCGSWNSYVEESVSKSQNDTRGAGLLSEQKPMLLAEVVINEENRSLTDIEEFDRVMGGGIISGSVTLIGGDPGIGKSTLALQIATSLSDKKRKVLYVSGEESMKQTKMRAERLTKKDNDSLYIVNQVDLNTIMDYIKKMKPDFVIIDSIQVIYNPELTSTPGSVSQVRECAAILTHLAKSLSIALFIIGHVTKDGMIAGPRVLEHIVDTVLYFEGERYSSYRILRAIKNRFGSTNEIGVFEMTSVGLEQITNPSEIFLAERPTNTSGSVVVPILEGTRPFLVEIQGLVSRSTFGVVRQKAQGFDANRLALLIAVLEKRLGLNIQDKDIFLNVVGGVKVMDPAADLGVVISIASALLEKSVSFDTAILGEVGLSSEVRSVSQILPRISEAQKLGFKQCIVPKNNLKKGINLKLKSMEIIAVENVKEALDAVCQ